MNNNGVNITITALDQASATVQAVAASVSGQVRNIGISFGYLKAQAEWMLGARLADMAKGFLEAADAAEGLAKNIDLAAGGQGAAVMRELREAVLDMPVSLNAAAAAFIRLRNAGIQPSLADFKAMAGVAGDMAGNADDNLGRLAAAFAALSQSAQLGADEFGRQLKGMGELIPVAEILRTRLGLTADQLGDLKTAGVGADQILRAILGYMRDATGGTDDFGDSVQKLANVWNEFKVQVMQAGPMQAVTQTMQALAKGLTDVRGQMDLRAAAADMADGIIDALEAVLLVSDKVVTGFRNIKDAMWHLSFDKATSRLEGMQAEQVSLAGYFKQHPTSTSMWGGGSTPSNFEQMLWDSKVSRYEELKTAIPRQQTYVDRLIAQMPESPDDRKSILAQAREMIEAARNVNAATAVAGPAAAKESALPSQSSFAAEGGGLSDAEIDKAWQAQQALYDKELQTRRDLAVSTAKYSGDETTARRLELQYQLEDLRAFADASAENAALVRDYAITAQFDITAAAAKEEAKRLELQRATAQEIRNIQESLAIDTPMVQDQQAADLMQLAQKKEGYLRTLREMEERGSVPSSDIAATRQQIEEWDKAKRAQIQLVNSNDVGAGFKGGIDQLAAEAKSGYQVMKDLTISTANAMQNAFSDFFFDAMMGKLKSFSDYFTGFLQSISRALADAIAEIMVKSVLVKAGVSAVMLAADGGVFQGGWKPLKAFASGGVVTGPTVGLVGEGRYNEAVVPLPDGRSIPVVMAGGGQQQAPNVKIIVNNNTGQQAQVRQDAPRFDGQEWVVSVFLDAYARNRMGLRTSLAGA